MKPMLDDPRYGSLVMAIIITSPLMAKRKVQPVLDALLEFKPTKPVVFAMLGEEVEVPGDIVETLRGLGVPFFRSPERALRALARSDRIRGPAGGRAARRRAARGQISACRHHAGISRESSPGRGRHRRSRRARSSPTLRRPSRRQRGSAIRWRSRRRPRRYCIRATPAA